MSDPFGIYSCSEVSCELKYLFVCPSTILENVPFGPNNFEDNFYDMLNFYMYLGVFLDHPLPLVCLVSLRAVPLVNHSLLMKVVYTFLDSESWRFNYPVRYF